FRCFHTSFFRYGVDVSREPHHCTNRYAQCPSSTTSVEAQSQFGPQQTPSSTAFMSLRGTMLTSASKSDGLVDRQRVAKSSRTTQQYVYNTTRFFPGRQRCARSACELRCRPCGAAYRNEP